MQHVRAGAELSSQSVVQLLEQTQEEFMYPLIKSCFVIAVGLSVSAVIAQAQGTKASKADQMFIKDAMEGDLAEVNMGKLAQEKA
jgi:hypothetical protein